MRAAIRAKVTAARMERAAAAERARDRQIGAGTISRSRGARSRRPRRQFIAVGGLSGTGKSQLARDLAPHIAPMPGAVIVRSDVERKALFGAGETEKLPRRRLHARGDRAGLCRRRRQGAPHPCRRPFGDRRCRIRPAAGTRSHRRGGGAANVPLQGCFSPRVWRPESPASAAAPTTPRMPTVGCPAQENYDLGQLEWAEIDASGTPADTLARAKLVLSS